MNTNFSTQIYNLRPPSLPNFGNNPSINRTYAQSPSAPLSWRCTLLIIGIAIVVFAYIMHLFKKNVDSSSFQPDYDRFTHNRFDGFWIIPLIPPREQFLPFRFGFPGQLGDTRSHYSLSIRDVRIPLIKCGPLTNFTFDCDIAQLTQTPNPKYTEQDRFIFRIKIRQIEREVDQLFSRSRSMQSNQRFTILLTSYHSSKKEFKVLKNKHLELCYETSSTYTSEAE